MFSGLVEKTGSIERMDRTGREGSLCIACNDWSAPLVNGESIAVNGVCLTLTRSEKNRMYFDVLEETFRKTGLGEKTEGSMVNLERALRFGDTIGGHFVTGHIDEAGTVDALTQSGRDWILTIGCSEALAAGMVPKGSIAIDGISLTVVDLYPTWFTVHLIPHTFFSTAISSLKPDDLVNLETDMLGKYVRKFLTTGTVRDRLTWETLRKHGFPTD